MNMHASAAAEREGLAERPPKPFYRFTAADPPSALAYLRNEIVWLTWDFIFRDSPTGGKWTKPPHSASTGRMQADWINARGFLGSFDQALATMRRRSLAGIGISLQHAKLTGIDRDRCINDSGSYSASVAELLEYGESYAEVSPGGDGIHILCQQVDLTIKRDDLGLEVYSHGRFFTVTGHKVDGAPDVIAEAHQAIDHVVKLDAETPRPMKNGKASPLNGANGAVHHTSTNGSARPSGGDFFSKVKELALKNLDSWVPALHPTARKQATGAWRVSSQDLGRDLDEDLSYHPDGINDFGEEVGSNPIEALLTYGNVSNVAEAAFWLCQEIGVEPASLGWRGGHRQSGRAGAAKQAELLAAMDLGLSDNEIRSQIGDGNDANIAEARAKWSGEARRMRAHARTAERPDARTNVPTDGAAMLDSVHAFLGRFVAFPSQHVQDALTLWIAHTHAMDAWESTPRIAFLSQEPGSGKTRCLEVTEALVPRPVEAINVTPAYLFRKVASEDGRPTLLFDEIDTVFGPKAKDNEEIRALLNAGHRKGAVAGRCIVVGKQVRTEEIPAYCAVALAGLGHLPDTILARSVVCRMRRRAPDETVEQWRRRIHMPEGAEIRDQLSMWAQAALGTVINQWPEMPEGVRDRDADVWEALVTIADVAGGSWSQRARIAAVALVTQSKETSPTLGVRLLMDLHKMFGDANYLATENILRELHRLEESPWGDMRGKPLNDRNLAKLLKGYDIKPKVVRIGAEVVRGYAREDFHDAWKRYLLPSA